MAFGKNFTSDDRLEFNYLRLNQRDLEFPGLFYDIDKLKTNGYEAKYTGANPAFCDFLVSEVWFNRTDFRGQALADSKQVDVPLDPGYLGPDGIELTDGTAITNGRGAIIWISSEASMANVGWITSHLGRISTYSVKP